MNGIVGLYRDTPLDNAEARARRMLQSITHRGPDVNGLIADEHTAIAWCGIGNRPQVPSVDGLTVILDGQIENTADIRNELKNAGFAAEGINDEALLVNAFKAFGTDLFGKLKGPFALAIRDRNSESLYLVRDGFGIKPLYFTRKTTDGSLLFASEIKAFTVDLFFDKELNADALRPFLTFDHSLPDETFFKGVFRVHAGEFIRFSGTDIERNRFFQLPLGTKKQTMEQAVASIQKVLEKRRPESTANIGGFLSGGVDSGYLTSLCRPAATFSVGFPGEADEFNETTLAKTLSDDLGIPNHTRLVKAEEVFRAFPDICYHLDEPPANLSTVALWFLAEETKKHVGTAISGEGADEIFAGYHWYNKSYWQLIYERVLPVRLRRSLAEKAEHRPNNRLSRLFLKYGPVESNFCGHAKTFLEHEAADVLQPAFMSGPSPREVTAPIFKDVAAYDDLTKMRYLDFHLWSPVLIMQKADRMCMAHGLTLYMPYADYDVLTIGMSLPRKLLLKPSTTKLALRKAAESTLPEPNTNRSKLGFLSPVREWLKREPFASQVRQAMNEPAAAKFFRTDALNRLLDEHISGKKNNGRKLWTVYSFLIWYRRFFPEDV